MANLLQNEYSDVVEKYTIVDCRYPYEYNGGHILVCILLGLQFVYSVKSVIVLISN